MNSKEIQQLIEENERNEQGKSSWKEEAGIWATKYEEMRKLKDAYRSMCFNWLTKTKEVSKNQENGSIATYQIYDPDWEAIDQNAKEIASLDK